jgi:hypothetical protein
VDKTLITPRQTFQFDSIWSPFAMKFPKTNPKRHRNGEKRFVHSVGSGPRRGRSDASLISQALPPYFIMRNIQVKTRVSKYKARSRKARVLCISRQGRAAQKLGKNYPHRTLYSAAVYIASSPGRNAYLAINLTSDVYENK